MKASILQPDGTYRKQDLEGKERIIAQDYFCKEATENAKQQKNAADSRVFVPAEPVRQTEDNIVHD